MANREGGHFAAGQGAVYFLVQPKEHRLLSQRTYVHLLLDTSTL